MSDPAPLLQHSALIAACQASEATAELLRYHRDGPHWPSCFGDVEVIEKLAEAVALACAIQLDPAQDCPDDANAAYRAHLRELAAICNRFIECWAA